LNQPIFNKMKSNFKFLLGLGCGIVISFITLQSTKTLNATSPQQNQAATATSNETIDGKWVTMESMQSQITAYKNDFITQYKLPENTSTGGFIKRSLLSDITGPFDSSYVKYSFYYDGDGKIGLLFQKQSEPDNAIRTGSAAFCPMLCDYP